MKISQHWVGLGFRVPTRKHNVSVLEDERGDEIVSITYQTDRQKVGFHNLGRLLLFIGSFPIFSGWVERVLSWYGRPANCLSNFIPTSAENCVPIYFALN